MLTVLVFKKHFRALLYSRQEYLLPWSRLPCPPPGDLPNLGIEPRSPILQEDSFPGEPPGKPKNTGVGNLSFLQWIFRPRNQTGSPALQADFLPAELPGKLVVKNPPSDAV